MAGRKRSNTAGSIASSLRRAESASELLSGFGSGAPRPDCGLASGSSHGSSSGGAGKQAPYLSQQGKYAAEFDEVREIGAGGFGVVLLARHRLDGRAYAVKKITFHFHPRAAFQSEPLRQTVLHEVSLLSQLDHPNVTRYYTAWVEDEWGKIGAEEEYDTLEGEQEPKQLEEEEEDDDDDEEAAAAAAAVVARPRLCYAVRVYIQMAYYSHDTLHTWLRQPWRSRGGAGGAAGAVAPAAPAAPAVDAEQNMRIFLQAVLGLQHIHEKGLLHLDVKPANILISETDAVKIADFGLSCDVKKSGHSGGGGGSGGGGSGGATEAGEEEDGGDGANAAVQYGGGTPLYAAPELMDRGMGGQGPTHGGGGGGGFTRPSRASDIYSLGIVLLELFHPFGSEMERAKVGPPPPTRSTIHSAFSFFYVLATHSSAYSCPLSLSLSLSLLNLLCCGARREGARRGAPRLPRRGAADAAVAAAPARGRRRARGADAGRFAAAAAGVRGHPGAAHDAGRADGGGFHHGGQRRALAHALAHAQAAAAAGALLRASCRAAAAAGARPHRGRRRRRQQQRRRRRRWRRRRRRRRHRWARHQDWRCLQ